MVDWQITATTIFCERVGEEVTVMVYKDWSVKCTGHKRHGENSQPKHKAKPECAADECHLVLQYKEKLLSEEARKATTRQPS
ncbi:MAG: hypothetical protein HY665_04840 [Chloroflexi bacterium]|nr:hypothetical protein [Chloroflexota bacterium]